MQETAPGNLALFRRKLSVRVNRRAVVLEDLAASAPQRALLKRAGPIPKKGQDRDLELDFDDSAATDGPPGRWSSKTKRRRRQLQ